MYGQTTFALDITDAFLEKNSVDLSQESLILNDPHNQLSPEVVVELMSQSDYHSDKIIRTGQQYWYYIPLINHSKHTEWTIRSNNLLFDEIDFYLHCQGRNLQTIPRPPLGFDSPHFATSYYLPIVLPHDTQCGFLQRGKAALFEQTRLEIISKNKTAKASNLGTAIILLCIGVVVGLTLYYLLLYLYLHKTLHLTYVIYAISHLLLMLVINFRPDFIVTFFPSIRHALLTVGTGTVMIFILFTLHFMRPGIRKLRDARNKKGLLKLANVLVFLSWTAFVLLLLSALANTIYPSFIIKTANFYHTFYMACNLLIPLLSVVIALSGYKPAWIFLPAWTILTSSHIIVILDAMQVISLPGLDQLWVLMASALEMILLSIALGMTLRDSQVAKDRAQLAQENAELQMEQQEKFVSTLSHEIRTPLHAMLGSTTLLGRTELTEKQHDYWSTTHYAAESMYALVDNLLDRTQLKHAQEFGKDAEFSPLRLLENMIQLLQARANEKNLTIELQTDDLPDRLLGKPVILRRLLINLLGNALKYTDTGHIWVVAQWSSHNEELQVDIEDTGQGLSQEQLKQIKTHFNVSIETLYSQNSSTGLGLPICFEMVKTEGGKLTLESNLGEGTKVSFTLPMRFASKDAPSLKSDLSANASKALNILVVDDVASNRMIASELLKSVGHQVSQADQAEHALQRIKEQHFDVIISDIRMPGMDGITLLQKLREEYTASDLIIVITSAHITPQQQKELLQKGANDCLSKPYTPRELLSTLPCSKPKAQTAESAESSSTILSAIQQSLGDEKTNQVLAIYDKQLEHDITTIIHALKEKNQRTIRVTSHRIVSASKALGLDKQAQAASRMEDDAENFGGANWYEFSQKIHQGLMQLTER